MKSTEDMWFKLLTLFEQTNHLVKEGDWFDDDKREFYNLKDKFLNILVNTMPENVNICFRHVPYFKYSNITKDKAGALMRNDVENKPFEYYLSLVEPCSQDIELHEKATIELEIICENRLFCFHIPQNKTTEWKIDVNSLTRKVWISSREFHRYKFNMIKKEINELLEQIKCD